MSKEALANSLARCFLAGEPGVDGIIQRSTLMLGRNWNWIEPMARSFFGVMTGRVRPRHCEVVAFILRDSFFELAWSKDAQSIVAHRWLTESQRMQPVAAALSWDSPRIETAGVLADWFWLEQGQLEWFADLEGLGYKTRNPKLSHYHYRVLKKDDGGFRLIESPKPRLKEMQRAILDYILDKIPAHSATHGFVKGRSILSFANPHTARHIVVRMDMKDFFPSFNCARIQALFRNVGYPESVANLLGGLCTVRTPADVWKSVGDEIYSRRHLPQGAPSSPALANLCAYRMDCRLDALAQSAGAEYSRYADDLVFSGDRTFAKRASRFTLWVAAILAEEGFRVNHRKTRIMRQGGRQSVAGLTTNDCLNVRRVDFDRLKAILSNCIKLSPHSQNRTGHSNFREHLNGRIGFVEMLNPGRGAKLRAIFSQIVWT